MTSVSSNWKSAKANLELGGHFTTSSVKLNTITVITIINITTIIVAPGLVASAIGVKGWSFVAAVVQGTVALFDDHHYDYADDDGGGDHIDEDDDDGDDNLAGEERVDIREITKLKVVVVAAFENNQCHANEIITENEDFTTDDKLSM